MLTLKCSRMSRELGYEKERKIVKKAEDMELLYSRRGLAEWALKHCARQWAKHFMVSGSEVELKGLSSNFNRANQGPSVQQKNASGSGGGEKRAVPL